MARPEGSPNVGILALSQFITDYLEESELQLLLDHMEHLSKKKLAPHEWIVLRIALDKISCIPVVLVPAPRGPSCNEQCSMSHVRPVV